MATASPRQIATTFNLTNVNILNGFRPSLYPKQEGPNEDKPLYLSTLGNPVYTDLTFESIRYQASDTQTKIVPAITLQTVVMMISQTKNIIETPIQGRNGTVAEYIGMGDYQITINGIITSENGRYPRDEVAALKKMFDAPRPIPVISWYLQNLDIYDIIVKDYSFAQEPGYYSQQPFTMNCRSYEPVILQIS